MDVVNPSWSIFLFNKVLNDDPSIKVWNNLHLWDFVSFYSLHFSLFYRANEKHMPGLAENVFEYTSHYKGDRQTFCLTLIKSKNYRCQHDLMSLLTVATIHNLTIHLYRGLKMGLKRFDGHMASTNFEHIIFSIGIPTLVNPPSLMAQLLFKKFESYSIHYYKQKAEYNGRKISHQVWYFDSLLMCGFFLFSWRCYYRFSGSTATFPVQLLKH